MANDNVIDIVLRFLVDQGSQKAAGEAINGIGNTGTGQASGAFVGNTDQARTYVKETLTSMAQMGTTAQEARAYVEQMNPVFRDIGREIMADEEAVRGFGFQADASAKSVGNIDKNVQATTRNVNSMRGSMGWFILAMSGMQLERLSQQMLSPIDAYTKYAGQASGASSEWLATQKELQQATVSIGQSLAQAALPAMREMAGYALQVARYLEAHPEIAKFAAGFAGVAAVMGGIMMAVGQLMSGIMAFKMLMPATAAGAAAATSAAAGGAAAGTVAAAGVGLSAVLLSLVTTLAPLAVAIGTLVLFLKTDTGKAGVRAGGQLLTVGAYEAGKYLPGGSDERAAQWGLAIARLTGSVDGLGQASQNAAGKVSGATNAIQSQQQVDAFIAYQQQETKAAEDYEKQRVQIVEEYGKQRADAEANYEQERSKVIADYQTALATDAANYANNQTTAARNYYQSEANYEQDYYRNRTKAAADYGLEVQRAEEDHQRRMLQLSQDHDARMQDLARSQDAYGMLHEMQSYERDRQRAESDYAVESGRRNQDFQRRVAEMEQQFAVERSRRQADYLQQRADAQAEYALRAQQRAQQLTAQLKELDASHKAELAKLDAQKIDKLNQLARAYADERTVRYTALGQQLRDLNAYMTSETNLRTQYYANWTAQFQNFMRANLPGLMNGAYPVPAKAAGGYTSGLVMTGEEGYEWVLSNPVTRLAEKLAGGKLTQSKLVGMMLGGGGTNQNVTINQRIDGRITASDRRWIRDDMRGMMMEALGG